MATVSQIDFKMALVGPTGRTLKFLNNKNNLENLYLEKKLSQYKKEKEYNISHMEQDRLETNDFLKHIHSVESDHHQAAKKYLGRATPNQTSATLNRCKQRKHRQTRTAPPTMKKKNEREREEIPRGHSLGHKPLRDEIARESVDFLSLEKKHSMFLRLPGRGRHDEYNEEEQRKQDPKPNAKTLLDVMIGLNAFSHVPPRSRSRDDFVGTSSRRDSFQSDLNESFDDSSENIATKFYQKWRSNVAARRASIIAKLAKANEQSIPLQRQSVCSQRCTSTALESVPEDQPMGKRRTTKFSLLPQPVLPVIAQEDDEESMSAFYEWVREQKQLNNRNGDNDKSARGRAKRRQKSFLYWLKDRQGNGATRYHDPPLSDLDSESEPEATGEQNDISLDDMDEIKDVGNVMKAILQIRSRLDDPLDKRLNRFYTRCDKLKRLEEEINLAPPSKEQRRKWIYLTKGLDAALAESSDEEEVENHTV